MKSIHCTVGENNIDEHKFHITFSSGKPSRLVSVVAHPDLDGEVSSPDHTKDLRKGKALTIKRRSSFLIQILYVPLIYLPTY